VESFSTPQSNKRIVGQASPHPIGLQSCCSTPPCPLPLGCTEPQPNARIHALPRSLPLGPCRIHSPPGYRCSGYAGSTPHLDLHLQGHARSTHHRDPCHLAALDSSPKLDAHFAWIPTPQFPHPLAMGPRTALDPHSSRIPTSWSPCPSDPAGSPLHQDSCPSGLGISSV
jgi:hypothetical protein